MSEVIDLKLRQLSAIVTHSKFMVAANTAAFLFYLSDNYKIETISFHQLMSAFGMLTSGIALIWAVRREWDTYRIAMRIETDEAPKKVKQILDEILSKRDRVAFGLLGVSLSSLFMSVVGFSLVLLGMYDV